MFEVEIGWIEGNQWRTFDQVSLSLDPSMVRKSAKSTYNSRTDQVPATHVRMRVNKGAWNVAAIDGDNLVWLD